MVPTVPTGSLRGHMHEPTGFYLGGHHSGFKRPALERLRRGNIFVKLGGEAHESYLGFTEQLGARRVLVL
jgi:hypothetical protein